MGLWKEEYKTVCDRLSIQLWGGLSTCGAMTHLTEGFVGGLLLVSVLGIEATLNTECMNDVIPQKFLLLFR